MERLVLAFADRLRAYLGRVYLAFIAQYPYHHGPKACTRTTCLPLQEIPCPSSPAQKNGHSCQESPVDVEHAGDTTNRLRGLVNRVGSCSAMRAHNQHLECTQKEEGVQELLVRACRVGSGGAEQ